MSISRRNLLQLSGGVIAGSSLAGCSYFEEPRDTSLIIQNHTPEQQYLEVAVLESDAETRSPLFGEQFELEASNGDNSNWAQSFNQVFETQKAVVEVTTDKGTQQFTYYPTCAKDSDDTLTIRIQEDGGQIDWQAGCDGR